MESQLEKSCRNCGVHLKGPICHECGQKHFSKRWTVLILFKQFINQITNIEKGFFYTSKELFIFPGKLLKDYWQGKTVVYYNPIRYAIIWVTINLLLNFWLGIDDMIQASLNPTFSNGEISGERMKLADQQLDSWLNFLVLFLIPATSLVTFWLFYKKKKSFAEHLIMNSYILGQGALISSFTQFIFYFFPNLFSGYFIFYFLVGLFYDTYVLNKVFNEKWLITFLKALVKGITGLLVLFTLIYLISALILSLI